MFEGDAADLTIDYCFEFEDGTQRSFDICLDPETLEQKLPRDAVYPEWVQLDVEQCDNCPLKKESSEHCPVAARLAQVVDCFGEVLSHDEITVQVTTGERTVSKQTTAQRGVGSMLGVLFATSGCPHTTFLKPMARYHLPFSTEEETIFRVAGMYLLSQYFKHQAGDSVDWDMYELVKHYDDLHAVNKGIAKRIRHVSSKDAPVNAVILLDMFTNLMPFVIGDRLDEVAALYKK